MSHAAIRKLVADSVAAALETQTATMTEVDNSIREIHVAKRGNYKEFISYQPFYFNGMEGVVGLIRWFERTKLVFSRSNCAKENKVAFATGNDLKTYVRRFQELAVLCPDMVPNNETLMEAFIGGLPRSIEGNVTASKPQTLEEAISIAQKLMDQVTKHNSIQGTNDHKQKDVPYITQDLAQSGVESATRFIKDFSKIAKSLTILTQKDKKFVWGKDQEMAFQILKQKLFEAPILALPEGNDDFVVYCDASIQDYDCEIRYHPGKANVVADALSQKRIIKSLQVKPLSVRSLIMTIHSKLPSQILEAQTKALKEENVQAENLRGMEKAFEIRTDGTRCIRNQIWLPLFGPEIIHETTKKIVQIRQHLQATRDRQRSYAKKKREAKSSVHWPFKILNRIGLVAYKLELLEELSNVHNTFYVSNLKKCLSDESLIIPIKELKLDDKLNFVEEPVEIMDQETKQLRQSRIPIIKVRWNSKRGP
uniref:Putative reverse transcriptase domain-containing protein n=1 Tax=Tanacetum cinerariifolium TaxID=118510 RepID=A0A699GLF1_TANCI|nr:putative reverse transcriptase domain-containing protein [Tanacetum cinerariifolium]